MTDSTTASEGHEELQEGISDYYSRLAEFMKEA